MRMVAEVRADDPSECAAMDACDVLARVAARKFHNLQAPHCIRHLPRGAYLLTSVTDSVRNERENLSNLLQRGTYLLANDDQNTATHRWVAGSREHPTA